MVDYDSIYTQTQHLPCYHFHSLQSSLHAHCIYNYICTWRDAGVFCRNPAFYKSKNHWEWIDFPVQSRMYMLGINLCTCNVGNVLERIVSALVTYKYTEM